MTPATYRARRPDGSEVLVEIYSDGSADVAFKEGARLSWGPRIPMQRLVDEEVAS